MSTEPQFHYLYVEDDPLSREVMEMLLTQLIGVKSLITFDDSTNFMPRVRTLNPTPDLILLDIHITPEDGYTLLKQLRSDAQFATARIIAVTASVMVEEVRQLQSSGFDGAIAKPLDMTTFPTLIRRIQNGEAVWQIQ